MNTTPRFTKLNATGETLPPDATDHAMVHDAKTGLTWPARVLDGQMTHKKATEACSNLELAGGGWRLPTLEELESIRDITRFRPAIDTDFFPGTPSDWHWTSSPVASGPDGAWIVLFYDGVVYLRSRRYAAFVRAVRGPVAASQ